MKHMALGRKKSSSKGPSVSGSRVSALPVTGKTARSRRTSTDAKSATNQKYVVCVRNDDYPASLELRKLYRLLEDDFAARHGMVRVIDESGEDYLYPSDFFVQVDLPVAIQKTLARIA
jgi:hypothetical protein